MLRLQNGCLATRGYTSSPFACSPKALKEMTLIIFLCIYGWLTKVRKEITLCSRKCSLVPRVREPGNEVVGNGVIISLCKASTASFVTLRQGKKLPAVPHSSKRKNSRFLLYSIPNYTVFNENPWLIAISVICWPKIVSQKNSSIVISKSCLDCFQSVPLSKFRLEITDLN